MNNSTPLVSVLIPCYNAERWVERTVQSVLEQTWQELEVIIVDDGSDDNSVGVIRNLSSNRIKLIEQSNLGAAAARNRGFNESKGEFVQFLDADDLLSPRKIEQQMTRLRENPDCVASCEWARFQENRYEAEFVPDDTWQDLEPVDWLVRSFSNGGGMLYPALWLLPRKVLEKAGPWRDELSLNDDGEFFTRVLLISQRVLFCEGARTYYRSGIRGSLSGLKSRKGWESQFKVVDLCQGYLLAQEDSDRTRRACSILWQVLAHSCYPYNRNLANQALRRAAVLHSVRTNPEGGTAFRIVSRLLGWKVARRLQRLSGRP